MTLQNIEFEIPVKIQKGSWEALFPDNIDELLIKGLLAWGAGKYAGTALTEMAKNDFKNLGFKDIFKRAFKGMTWVIKIAIHLGSLSKKQVQNIVFTKDNTKASIKNSGDTYLEVPVEYLSLFNNCADNLFGKIAKIIEPERELIISYSDLNEGLEVKVDNNNKSIFVKAEDTDEVLFPELLHNDYVELQGHITRGNESANTIGFQFNGHILTCYPDLGNIIKYKEALFLNCILKGYIDRLDKDGEINEKRPKVRFIQIQIIDESLRQSKLFN